MTGVLATADAGAGTGRRSARHRERWPLLAAVALAGLGAVYRLVMLGAEVPPTNSDEATMGLAALHILGGRDLPAFFYGQHYMGTIEAYVAVPIFALAGPSVLGLRLPNLLLYLAFLAVMWLLTRRLYSSWFATFAVGLLALGSDRILKNQLIAAGGYPELNPAGALLMLLAVDLGRGSWRRPLLGYALWGLVGGLVVWDDWLALPYLAAAGAILVWFRRWELWGRAGLTAIAAALVGAAPLLVDYAVGGRNPLSAFLVLTGGSGASWPDRLYGGVLFGLPMGTGMCAPSHCAPWQLWWGVALPVLLGVAGLRAVRVLREAAAGPAPSGAASERIRQAGRLAMVVAALLSLAAYACSDAAGSTPVESARYLSCLLISLPAALWPLWAAAARRPGPVRAAAVGGLSAVAATALVATAALVARAPSISDSADRRGELVAALRQLGVTRVYSDYWTCNGITFATRERIVCAVLGDNLGPGYDRYRPYRDLVARADRPAYVVRAGSPLGVAVADHLAPAGAGRVAATAGGYDVYWPTGRVGLPLS